jgi:hypothetical protein
VTQDGSVNVSLGFAFPYQNSLYNTITLNVNGFVLLNGTAIISAYTNTFSTNGSGGTVFYRQISYPNASLTTLSSTIISAMGNFSTFQLVLLTDYVNSFLLFYYVRLDSPCQMACLSYIPVNSSNYTSFATSLNCTTGGTFVENVNIGGISKSFRRFVSRFGC